MITKQFFAAVQNKLHFAITGKTAAEIIQDRVNSQKNKIGAYIVEKISKRQNYA